MPSRPSPSSPQTTIGVFVPKIAEPGNRLMRSPGQRFSLALVVPQRGAFSMSEHDGKGVDSSASASVNGYAN